MASDDKYDRQLRLWGSHGQRALSESSILLLNAGPCGSETLKNLVLPGVGKVTIVDERTVSKFDLTNNFFVHPKDVGYSRAKSVAKNLSELNPDVECVGLARSVEDLIDSADSKKFFDDFSLVVASQMRYQMLCKLESVASCVIVACGAFGFVGFVRVLSKGVFLCVENMQLDTAEDLRVANPFKELLEWSATHSTEKHHTPYVGLLLNALAKHESLPASAEELEKFKQKYLASNEPSENVLEAMQFAYLCKYPLGVPGELAEAFDCERTLVASEESNDFWVILKALKEFHSIYSVLPVSGVVPDMASSSEAYSSLQTVYKTKANQDFGEVLKIAQSVKPSVDSNLARRMCANCRKIAVVKPRTLLEETQAPNLDSIAMATMDGIGDATEMSPLRWYLCWKACDDFFEAHSRFPSPEDVNALTEIASKYSAKTSCEVSRSVCEEMCRYEGGEVHVTASVIGGVASQEAVKLLTRQCLPLNGTYVFNGISNQGASFAL